MTDTNTLAPADAEILDAAEDFRSQYTHGGTTFDEFDEIGFAHAVLAKWGAPAAAQPVGFDYKTAANLLNEKTATDDEIRLFVAHSRWAHDDRDGLRNSIADLRREIAQRDAEIALLKTSLLDAESPTQAAQAQGEDMTQDEMIEECIIACEALKIEYAEIAASPLVTAQGANIYRAMSAGANNCMVALRELQAQHLTEDHNAS